MAKVQTRRSIALSEQTYVIIKEAAECRGMSLAALVEAALSDLSDRPLVSRPLQKVEDTETIDVEATSSIPDDLPDDLPTTTTPFHFSKGFCAICCEETSSPRRLPLGKNDALVVVCDDCHSVSPRSGRYSFNDGGRDRAAALCDGDRR